MNRVQRRASRPDREPRRERLPLTALLVLFLLVATAAPGVGAAAEGGATDASSSLPHWKGCVRDIGRYFVPINVSAFGWARKKNPCGFTTLTLADVRRKAFFPDRDSMTFSFSGDSTGIRAYIKAVNTYHPPADLVASKVAKAPEFMEHKDTDKITGKATKLRYFRLMYIAHAAEVVEKAIRTSNGGMFVLTVGNWDLNWKIQPPEGKKGAKKSKAPGMPERVRNLEQAKAYWTRHVQKVLERIQETLAEVPVEKRPLIIFREQFLPNCAASRFSHPSRAYRMCAPLVRPTVVPMYRRVLAPLAWALNIPVLPMEHLFRDEYRYCRMDDGVHLNAECMLVEQQHIWNAYLLMRHEGVVQGSSKPLPKATDFLDQAKYDEWADTTGLASPTPDRSELEFHQRDLLGGVLPPPPVSSGGVPMVASPRPSPSLPIDEEPQQQQPSPSEGEVSDGSSNTLSVSTPPPKRDETGTAGPKLSTWAVFFEGNKLWFVVVAFFVAVSASFGSYVYMNSEEQQSADAA